MSVSRILSILFGLPPERNPNNTNLHAGDEDFIRTLAHAQTGYENAQNVIKAIDTKTTIVTGLSTLAAGFLIALIKWSIELDDTSPANLEQVVTAFPKLSTLLFIFVGMSFLIHSRYYFPLIAEPKQRQRAVILKNDSATAANPQFLKNTRISSESSG